MLDLMDFLQTLVAVSCFSFFLIYAWKILNWVWLKPKKLEKHLREQGLCGNPYRFLFGDLKDVRNMVNEAKEKPMSFSNDIVSQVIPFVTTNIQNHGKNSFLWLGPTPAVLVTEPELMKEVFSKSYVYHKIPGNPLTRLLVQGVATLENEKWAKHRRLINPAFHHEKVKELVQTAKSCEIDVFPYLQTLASDAISRTAFGSNYEEERKIFELQTEQTMHVAHIFRTVYIPGWRFVPTKRNRTMKEIKREVKSLILDLINKRMKLIEAGDADKQGDLLGILLESNYNEMKQHGSKSVGMEMEEVIEECKLFYFAGQETTSVLHVWTMILLSKHPDWQTSAREEVRSIFGSKTPEYDGLSHLKIVTMILNEVLRLYSPAVMFQRTTACETQLGKTTLPAGVQLMMLTLALHHDKETWGDDVEEFNPERFREGVSKAMKGHFSFFPFGWGPRICIGQNFVVLEAGTSYDPSTLFFRAFPFLHTCSSYCGDTSTTTWCSSIAKKIIICCQGFNLGVIELDKRSIVTTTRLVNNNICRLVVVVLN